MITKTNFFVIFFGTLIIGSYFSGLFFESGFEKGVLIGLIQFAGIALVYNLKQRYKKR